MTAITEGSRPGQRRARVLPTPILLGLVTAVVSSLSWVQWWRPVIEHDDWRQIISSQWIPAAVHTAQLAADGRWLNYWTWLAGEPLLSARAAVLIFAAGWLVFTAVFVRAVTSGWWAVPLAVVVYAAPMMADISSWPATLFPPMTALAVGAPLLWSTRERFGWHLLIIVATCSLTVLGYPPFALLLLALLTVLHYRDSWRRLLIVAGAFTATYVATILVTFALNDLRFGTFGLKIAPWRHPTPLNGISALMNHLGVGVGDWKLLLEAVLLPAAVALVALAIGLADKELRRPFAIIALAFALSTGLDLAPTILHGVSTPFRAMSWVWLYLAVVVGWTALSRRSGIRVVGRIVVVAIAVWGAAYWADAVVVHQRFQNAIGRIESAAVSMAVRTGDHITVAPDAPIWTNVEGSTAEQLRSELDKESAVASRLCLHGCFRILRYVAHHHITRSVFYDGNLVVVRLPASLDSTALDVQPKPTWLQPVPWPADVRQ